jgi:hypothetical protein
MQPIIDRWNRAIADVLARFDDILAEAAAGSRALIPRIQFDLTPLGQPWGAVEHQMHRHSEEISEAWNQISDELAEVDGLPEQAMFVEGSKRDRASAEIEIRYTRAYRTAMSAAAEVMRQRALASDAQSYHCTGCGAPLDRIQLSGMALNVECGYCRAINTIEPGQALRAFAAVGAMYLAERDAFPLWEAMTRAQTEINQYRDRKQVPFALLQHFEAAARAYWTTRFDVEATFVPEQRQFVAQKVASYMQSVNRTLRQHWQWRQQTGSGNGAA